MPRPSKIADYEINISAQRLMSQANRGRKKNHVRNRLAQGVDSDILARTSELKTL